MNQFAKSGKRAMGRQLIASRVGASNRHVDFSSDSTPVLMSSVIAEGADYVVHVLHIPLRALRDFRPPSVADVICIDIHECGVDETIRGICYAHDYYRDGDGNVAPPVVVLGDLSKLSNVEVQMISDGLEVAGAIFQEWPDGVSSFRKAFDVLAVELSETYGSVDGLWDTDAESFTETQVRELVAT